MNAYMHTHKHVSISRKDRETLFFNVRMNLVSSNHHLLVIAKKTTAASSHRWRVFILIARKKSSECPRIFLDEITEF